MSATRSARIARGFRPDLEAFRTTGSSPTVHLLGPGAVGRALLRLLATRPFRLVAVTDSTATLLDPAGLDPLDIAEFKTAGRHLDEHAGARALNTTDALTLGGADLVVDATATDPLRAGWAQSLDEGVLRRGARLALAAKDALVAGAAQWLDTGLVGCNAVLGGTGLRLTRELAELRDRVRTVRIAGSASTTAILQALESGQSFRDGLAVARERGFLEADPELDLRGDDAVAKIAIVASALAGTPIPLSDIACTDLRALDVEELRSRAPEGRTTRLIGSWERGSTPRVAYETLPVDTALAIEPGEVAYSYTLDDGTTRVHRGRGLGAVATAEAVLADLDAFGQTTVSGGVR
jgi:homoserine dehydrogenase